MFKSDLKLNRYPNLQEDFNNLSNWSLFNKSKLATYALKGIFDPHIYSYTHLMTRLKNCIKDLGICARVYSYLAT